MRLLNSSTSFQPRLADLADVFRSAITNGTIRTKDSASYSRHIYSTFLGARWRRIFRSSGPCHFARQTRRPRSRLFCFSLSDFTSPTVERNFATTSGRF